MSLVVSAALQALTQWFDGLGPPLGQVVNLVVSLGVITVLFAMIYRYLPDVGGPEGAQSGADKLIAALRRPFRVEGHQVRVSASIGIALFPGDGDDGDLLMRMADTAMYAAKRSGGGCRAYEKEPA